MMNEVMAEALADATVTTIFQIAGLANICALGLLVRGMIKGEV